MYVIGENKYGSFGLNHEKKVLKLLEHPRTFKHVVCGRYYNIYIDLDNNLWVSGANGVGQCGVDTNYHSTSNLIEITYFKTNNIEIKKIYASVCCNRTAWISNKNKLYMNGSKIVTCNDESSWNIIKSKCQYEPILIHGLYHVVDVALSVNYSLALSSIPVDKIITGCFRQNKLNENKHINLIPNDLINLIIFFYGNTNTVYSTTFSKYGGNGHNECKNEEEKCEWKAIPKLENKQIIKIAAGAVHSLFLESNGTVWSCGYNWYHQLGFDDRYNNKSEPMEITYFTENNVRIRDIKCGRYHNLAIDDENRVYSWGYNDHGECGVQREKKRIIQTPTLIMCQVKSIECGYSHSYISTHNGEHYLFGTNYYGECLKPCSAESWRPYCINPHIGNKNGDGITLKSVRLGSQSTIIIK